MSNETTGNVFEKAARVKLRFATNKGLLTAEDLWELPLTSDRSYANLDDLAKQLNRQLKDSTEQSFVTPHTAADAVAQLSFDLVKHIIDVKLEERDVARATQDRRKTKARIMELIATKQDEALATKSVEELTAMVEAL
jgi:hypothetical protein